MSGKLFRGVRSLAAIWAVMAIYSQYSTSSAQVEYVKICDAYGTGFYYMPGSDACLKIGGKYTIKNLPPGTDTPAPPAGCNNCAELDKEIARLTDRFNKLEGKGVPRWQEDIASDIANLRAAKAECAKVCTPPPTSTTQSGDGGEACRSYGTGFYYVPGKYCIQVTTKEYVLERLQSRQAVKPPAGCSSCAALDVQIAALRTERAEWAAKRNTDNVSAIDFQIQQLSGLKSGCQSACRTAERPQRPLETFVPPSRAKTPPGVPAKSTTGGYRPDGALH